MTFARILRPLAVAAALSLSAGDAAAQMEFAGIPWGTPAAQAADRLQGMGYVLRGVDQDGDYVFRADGGALVAKMDPQGLVQVEREWTGDPARLPALQAHLADSLRAAFGEPYRTGPQGASWNRGDAWVHAWLRPATPDVDSTLYVLHSGPADAEEERRRWELRDAAEAAPADSAVLGGWAEAEFTERWQQFVDTARVAALGGGLYGVRLLDQWVDPRRLENGLVYQAAVTEAELDCRGFGLRRQRTIPLYRNVRLSVAEVPEADRQWYRPPSGHKDGRSIRHACAVLAGRP